MAARAALDLNLVAVPSRAAPAVAVVVTAVARHARGSAATRPLGEVKPLGGPLAELATVHAGSVECLEARLQGDDTPLDGLILHSCGG